MTLVPIQANASDIRPQIINGDRANVNDYASFASLFLYLTPNYYSTQSFCGATIINQRFAMTAAHCVVGNEEVLKYTVVAPQVADERDFPNGNVQFVRIKAFYYPDNFVDRAPFANDIALLEFDQPLNTSDYSYLFNFSINDVYPTSGEYITIGHGLTYGTEPSGSTSTTLLETKLTFVDKTRCRNNFHPLVTNSQICFDGALDPGDDYKHATCSGDSGGPVYLLDGGVYRQIGLTSYGPVTCGNKDLDVVSVFTEISEFKNWIQNVMAGNVTAKFYVATVDGQRVVSAGTPVVIPSRSSGGGGSIGFLVLFCLCGITLLFRK